MRKRTIVTVVGLGLAGIAGQQPSARLPRSADAPLKEERMTIEYTPAAGEAVLRVEAESESRLDWVEIHDPRKQMTFELRAARGDGLGLSGFYLETAEMSVAQLLSTYPEGEYAMRARSASGAILSGGARLDHELLRAPLVLRPTQGAAGVPTVGLEVTWLPDGEAVGYHVVLEQGESDTLAVKLPASATSFLVPPGVLRGGTVSHVEVGAESRSGNLTMTEIEFTTL